MGANAWAALTNTLPVSSEVHITQQRKRERETDEQPAGGVSLGQEGGKTRVGAAQHDW